MLYDGGSFQHKLANGYLPSFLRRLYRTPFDIYGERLHLFLKVFVVIVVLPDFARFVREHTKEAQEFWLVHVERVSTFPLEFFVRCPLIIAFPPVLTS